MKDISAVILAGGENTRFPGFNKAFLKFGKKRIIDLILGVLKDIFPKVMIITNKLSDFSEFEDVLVVRDEVKNCGPIGGIYTGLKKIKTKSAFFVACDMPFLNKKLIKKILKISCEENHISVIPYTKKGYEPLFAVYNKAIIANIKGAIRKKEFSIIKALEKSSCRYLRLNGSDSRTLTNINTYNDYENRYFKNNRREN